MQRDDGPWVFEGPTDETDFYDTSGTTLSGVTGQYIRYKAFLTSDSDLTKVCITFERTILVPKRGHGVGD